MKGERRRRPGARATTGGSFTGRAANSARVERLRVESLAAGGASLARRDGAVVFLPGGAPGDLVDAEVDATSRPMRGRLLRVVEPSPDRVKPACGHVDACGGCNWMHLSLDAQERAHEAIVGAALRHAIPGEIPPIRVHAAASAEAYRTRARVLVRVDRGVVRVGYRASASHAIAAIDRCVVLDSSIAPVVDELRVVFQGARGEGDVHVARGEGKRPIVDVVWKGELPAAFWSAIDAKVASAAWAGARVLLDGASRPAIFGDPRPRLLGADGAPLVVAAGGFAQPSDEGGALLARRVADLAAIAAKEPRNVLELFAGSGTLSILLARGAASFASVEIESEAVVCARQNLAERGLDGRLVVADADAFSIPRRVDVVVIDPPRSGAAGAARAIAASSARIVVYAACDPQTLARDVRELAAAGFAITHVETVELFPQTSHVETVVRLARVRPANSTGSASRPDKS